MERTERNKNRNGTKIKRTGSIHRKVKSRQHKAEVMIAGEQLRLRLHDGKLIKEHRYHLRNYPNCFVAHEVIDWLVSHKEVPNRQVALQLMQHLIDHDIVHHVCDKSPIFKDAKMLYRFRKDDGTFPFNIEVKVFMRGQSLYEHLIGGRDSILQLREEKGVMYERSFPGCQFIDWLLQNGEVPSRRQGLELCRALLEHGIIQHVSLKHNFFDSGLLYKFCINFRRRRRLSELLNENEHDEEGVAPSRQEEGAESPFVLRKNPSTHGNTTFLSIQPSELKAASGARRGSLTNQQVTGSYSHANSLTSGPVVRCNPKSVLRRNVTCEELLSPGAPFIRRVLTVLGDALGWGFVVRGRSPCYVQAVDPSSPAATAGVKVRQFVCQVNGRSVLHLDYRTLRKLVMTGPRTVVLEVMEPIE
ncbi:DEP domain-containing mTOR-interacting protein [Alosa pseudoharengus]|uniref:DEP domain-containing mTOR-interacting protein n=1 Tax=Alosa pseudoharengus TaxID=34774 RepID=UPI003F8A3966